MIRKLIVFTGSIIFFQRSSVIENRAATLTVSNKNNAGAGSLRQTIVDANDGDKIIFAAAKWGLEFAANMGRQISTVQMKNNCSSRTGEYRLTTEVKLPDR